MPGSENCECALWIAGSVTPSNISPNAVKPSPSHWRGPTRKPNSRSAITASSTTPPASTAWTTDIGATASAATCAPQAASATSIPIVNQREANRSRAERSGWRTWTAGAATAPRCLYRNARFETNAQTSASRMPM